MPDIAAPSNAYDEAASAVVNFREQKDQWAVADALNAAVQPNTPGQGEAFNAIQRRSLSMGVKPLSVSAMRQYRDTAARWAPDARIPGLTYTAHRRALGVPNPSGLLGTLITAKGGARNVTTADVTRAVAAATGQPTTTQARQQAAAATIDWNSDVIVREALVKLSNMHPNRVAHALDSFATSHQNTVAANLRILADTIEFQTGKNRPAPKQVGGAHKKAAPVADKPAKPAAPAPKGGKRRGRVKGA